MPEFDLNAGQIKVTFDEVIDRSSFDATGVTLYDYIFADVETTSYQLTNGSIVESDDSTELTIQMTGCNLATPRLLTLLATRWWRVLSRSQLCCSQRIPRSQSWSTSQST
jgi:hypothetical protein